MKTRQQHRVNSSQLYHIHTIWLFTRTDLKTIVIPSAVFGAVCTLSGPVLTIKAPPSILEVAKRIPVAAFWAWINLLPFAIDNQRQPDSIEEDAENKAWRPLPSKRLTPEHAKLVMLVSYALAVLSSIYLGGLLQCIALVGLGYWYNALRGADTSCIIRNFINTCGYICFTSGTLHVVSEPSVALLKPAAHQWLLIIGSVILTTIQSQDMYDQAGDSLRGRWTVPLVMGDSAPRWTIAVPVAFWSWFCPTFWQLGPEGLAVTMIPGTCVIWRILTHRTVKADRISFRIYNLWIVSLYMSPLIALRLRR